MLPYRKNLTLAERAAETARLFWLLVRPFRPRPELIYDVLSTHNLGCSETLFINLGYWKEADDVDEACRALAVLLGEASGMGPGDRVLDVGNGFADQDMLWLDRFQPREIVGVNVTASQVELGQRRVTERGMSDRIRLEVGSAARLRFPDASFDKVVALESASHFDTRDDFFREAYRVLKPGGRLAMADNVPRDAPVPAIVKSIFLSLWQVPKENWYGADEHVRRLREAGFQSVTATSIADHVFEPSARYWRTKGKSSPALSTMNPLLKRMVLAGGSLDWMDYIVFTAEKPAL